MALPERIRAVEKEIMDAVAKLKNAVEEFEALKSMMNNVADAMRTGKVPPSKK